MSLLLPGFNAGPATLVDRLMVQCSAADVEDVLPLLGYDSGVVVTGREAGRAAARARRVSPLPVLSDRGRYAGVNRTPATAGVSADWVDAQLLAGAPVALTDSGYLGPGDHPGLAAILAGTAALGEQVVAVLPIHPHWLTADLPRLIAAINDHGVPVALVVEHRDDPFAATTVLQGLTRLLAQTGVPVLLLRSDLSSLGAIAHGAIAAAFGVRPSLRHLYPSSGSGYAGAGAVTSALWRPGLYMVKVDRLAAAHARDPRDPVWVCECAVCRGRTLDWLYLDAGSQEVLAHNLEVALTLRDDLLSYSSGPQRRTSWRAQCASAEYQFTDLASRGLGWTIPPAIRGWKTA